MADSKKTNQIVGFDITIPHSQCDNYIDVGLALQSVANKFVFQLEDGSEDTVPYLHWQCRYKIADKIRLETHISQCRQSLYNGRISATSTGVHKSNNFNYVMKPQRIDGPWDDRNDDFIPDIRPPTTKQLRMFLSWDLLPWQKKIIEFSKEFDMRKIHLIVDPIGHFGKSIFAEYMEYEGLAVDLMYTDSIKELMQQVHGQKKRKSYIADLPRGLNKKAMTQFICGIELLKNGVCYDPRYEWKKVRFDRPNVFIFANNLLRLECLSLDRWEFWVPTPCRTDIKRFYPSSDPFELAEQIKQLRSA